MPWIQISVSSSSQHCELIEATLLDAGALSVTLKDAADDPILEPAPGETPVWTQVLLTGLYDHSCDTFATRAQLENTLDGLFEKIEITPLEDQDWVRAWMVDYQPMRFGSRLWVCPSHLDPPEDKAITLKLDPGLAFGSGTHATTALCLEWLDKNIAVDETVLDYGCGSGILAIAALLLGARRACATDIDAQALLATKDNALTNRVADSLHICSPSDLVDQSYDVIIANILSGTLASLSPTISAYAHTGSRLVLSGILENQADDVITAYRPWFDLEIYSQKEEWVCLQN